MATDVSREDIINTVQSLDKNALWYFTVTFGTRALLVLGGFGLFDIISEDIPFITQGDALHSIGGVIVGGALFTGVVFLVSYVWSVLYRNAYTFTVTDRGIEQEWGVINKSSVTIGYDRIQNVNVQRNIFARLLGLSTIEIHTAGNNSQERSEGKIPGLDKERAEHIRGILVQNTYSAPNANTDGV